MRPIIIILLASFPVLPVAGQTPPADPQASVIRSSVNEVLLDLVVRDKHEKLVRDLKASEIEIYEDGVKQDPRTFRLVEGKEARESEDKAKAQPTAGAPAAAVNPLREINLVTLVFDQMSAKNRAYARESAEAFLNSELRPNTFVGVFSLTQRLHAIQQFSSDRKLLLAAVKHAATGAYSEFAKDSAAVLSAAELSITGGPGGISVAGAGPDTQSAGAATGPAEFGTSEGSAIMYGLLNEERHRGNTAMGSRQLDAIRSMIDNIARLPGRKSVLMFTEGLVLPANNMELFRSTVSAANRSNVSIYAIDVNGLSTTSMAQTSLSEIRANARTSGLQNQDLSGGDAVRGQFHQDDNLLYGVRAANTQQAMAELTESTGGFLVANTNDFRKPLRRIMEDVATHYEVSYTPKSSNFDGHFRAIEVKALRAGLTVHSRSGYFALPDLQGRQLQPFEAAALKILDARPLPHGIEFQSAALRFRPGAHTIQYGIVFEVANRSLTEHLDPKSKNHLIHASVLALIKDEHGQIVRKVSQDIPAAVPEEKFQAFLNGRVLFHQTVDLTPGRYTLESVVMDREGDKAAARRAVLVVAEPKNIELSSLELVRRVDPLEGGPDADDPFQFQGGKVTPALEGLVSSGSPPLLYCIVYPDHGNKEKPGVVLQILRDGKVVAQDTPALTSPDESGAIPLIISAKFEPGDYQVSVTLRQGEMVSETHLPFSVE